MRQYLNATLGITAAYLRRFTRDKTAMFFTFLFPAIFLFVFGTIFNNNNISFRVAVIDRADNEFSRQFVTQIKDGETFKVESEDVSLEAAKTRMNRGELDSILELPPEFGVAGADGKPRGNLVVYYQNGSEQSGKTVAAVMEQVLADINTSLGQPEAPFKVEEKATDDRGLSQFDYTYSGLLGFTLMSMAIFGLANSMPLEKKSGSFRRLRAAPFRAGQLIIGNGLFYMILALLSLTLMLALGIGIFDFEMRGSWLTFSIFTILATVMMVGFGLLIGGWPQTENLSRPLSHLSSFPIMFLSGPFFPRFLFPEWLQGITSYIPLTPVIDGLRRILTENASLFDLGSQLGIMAVWLVLVYVAAIKLFRWE